MRNLVFYNIAFSLLKKCTPQIALDLLNIHGNTQCVFDATSFNYKYRKNLPKEILSQIKHKSTFKEAEIVFNQCIKNNISPIFITDVEYPDQLRHIYSPPLLLYVQGKLGFDFHTSISIVGSRNASKYGKKSVDSLLNGLKYFNPTVISGLAIGIDAHAHQYCINQQLKTVGVLGGGLLQIYPKSNQTLGKQIINSGALISEYPPSCIPKRHFFPLRNRIIAGLSRATIIIEARKKSGSLITAEYALKNNREVFALAGNIDNPLSEGGHDLIKQHKASLLTSSKDIYTELHWEQKRNNEPKIFFDLSSLSTSEMKVYKTIRSTPLSLNKILNQSNLPYTEIAHILISLEAKHQLIKSLPGNQFILR